jgi:hypothetical protein
MRVTGWRRRIERMDGHPRARAVLFAALTALAFANVSLSDASADGHSSAPMQDCGTHMPAGEGDCPCCPGDPGFMAGCLSVCGVHAFAAAMPPLGLPASKDADITFVSFKLATANYPPPNPPPIR